ncbi:unnamed protein product [Brassica oleracea]
MEGKIFNGGAVGILEELIESAEEEVLLASCRLIKVWFLFFVSWILRRVLIPPNVFFLQLYPELEHCVGVQTIMGCLPFEKFVEACKDPQDETNEMRAKTLHKVALKIGYYVKPWNSEASREASLQEIVDKVRTIAHRRKRNVIRRDD